MAEAGGFVDAVKCMVAFGSNVLDLFALRAIDHCATLGAELARGRVPLTEAAVDEFSTHPPSGHPSHATAITSPTGVRERSSTATTDAAISRARSASAMSTGSNPPKQAGAPAPSSASSDGGAGEWYDLDGPENADVLDDQLDRQALGIRMATASADTHVDAGHGEVGAGSASYYILGFPVPVVTESFFVASGGRPVAPTSGSVGESGAPGSTGGGGGTDDYVPSEASDGVAPSMSAIFAHENTTDDAMLAADPRKGGQVRRFTDSRIHLQLWWPLLTGLARLVSSDPRPVVRRRALSALFALLRRYGPGFSRELWVLIYTGVLLPIFDDVRQVAESAAEASAIAQVRVLLLPFGV